jgi:hypothetical protein
MFALKFQMLQRKPIVICFGTQSFLKNITTNAKTMCVFFGHPKSELTVA